MARRVLALFWAPVIKAALPSGPSKRLQQVTVPSAASHVCWPSAWAALEETRRVGPRLPQALLSRGTVSTGSVRPRSKRGSEKGRGHAARREP